MTLYLGDYAVNSMIDFKWSTNAQDGASITRSTDGTLRVYKTNGTAERTSLAGITQTEDFDTTTGVHHVRVDLSDDTDAGFYAAGNEYSVIMAGMTIDTKTVNAVIAHFSIERAGGVLALLKAGTLVTRPDWANVQNPTTTVNLSGTTVATATNVTTVNGLAANVITATAIAAGALTAAKFAAGAFDAVWTVAARLLTAGTNIVLAKGTGVTGFNDLSAAEVNAEVDTALADVNLDHLVGTATAIPAIVAGTYIDQLMDDGTATYDRTTDSLQAIRDRGDAAWVTGAGGSITDMLNIQPLIPQAVDLANTATWRLGLMLTNALDDLPTTAEITPGTISIERKGYGATAWTAVVTDAACSEAAGLIYFDEVFDTATGYVDGDSLRITFKSQSITVAANAYEISDATGRLFYSQIRADLATVADIEDIVWDAPLSAHLDAGSTGAALNSNGTAIAAVQADTDNIQTRLPATLDTGRIRAVAEVVGDKTDYALSTAGNNAVRDAVTDDVIEVQGNYTLQQALSIVLAAVAGRTDTGGLVLRSPNGTAVRITATVDGSNNRTAMTLAPSA